MTYLDVVLNVIRNKILSDHNHSDYQCIVHFMCTHYLYSVIHYYIRPYSAESLVAKSL